MPHITLSNTPGGPIIDGWIGVSESHRVALIQAAKPVPKPVAIRGLIDTGASHTCVDPIVVSQLGLTRIGQCLVDTPSTGKASATCDQYDISLVILHPQQKTAYVKPAMPVICTELFAKQQIHALVGRDVLKECLFTYDGAMGIFILAY